MTKELMDYFQGDELAVDTWLRKYAQEGDVTPDDMHKRMAKEFARIDQKFNTRTISNPEWNALSYYGRHRDDLTEEFIYSLFKDFSFIIPQGSVMSQLGVDSIGSLSNCFVVGQPYDSYGGIMEKDEHLVQLMKRRGGVGIDISTLRPEGTKTSNAAKTSTGAVSFMHRYSNTTREVAQNGRRGALMISIDVNHPDIFDFVRIKRDLTQVTGANISIKLNDDFMKAVINDKDYLLRFPCDQDLTGFEDDDIPYDELIIYQEDTKVYVRRIKAKELWNEIIESAHGVAEPGLMFWDNMVDYSPDGVYALYRAITTNPCSEIGMSKDDACRLLATNLFSFVENPFTDESEFDYDRFYEYSYEAQILADNLVELELENIQRIINKIKLDPEPAEIKATELKLWENIKKMTASSRRTGTGFTALGDTLAALGIKYDSHSALKEIEEIMNTKMEAELDATIDMAIVRGPFKGWNRDLEWKPDGHGGVGQNSFFHFLSTEFEDQFNRMLKYGRRNVSWSTVAPTGTVSLMAQTTSGIEPLFMPFYTRRKKVNPGDDVKIDFVDQNGDSWQEFPVLHPKFKDWINSQSYWKGRFENWTTEMLQEQFEKSPWYGSTANDIDWIKRVQVQALIQKYITHSISSTINLPTNVSKEIVSEIYLRSWKEGLKGITVYRDGSRSGVLVTGQEDEFVYHDAPKRPRTLDADVYKVTTLGEHFTVIVGLYDGKPYEVFVEEGHNKDFFFADKGNNSVTKKSKGRYILSATRGNEELEVELALTISDEEAALTRMISTALRHGANIKFVVEQLNKADGTIVSFSKAIARTLKKYIPDGTKSTVLCQNEDCTGTRDNVIFEEGCYKCLDCGSSKCG